MDEPESLPQETPMQELLRNLGESRNGLERFSPRHIKLHQRGRFIEIKEALRCCMYRLKQGFGVANGYTEV